MCGRGIFLQHGNVENGISLSPKFNLAQAEWNRFTPRCQAGGARRRHHYHSSVARALANLRHPDVGRGILRQRNRNSGRGLFRGHEAYAGQFERAAQAILNLSLIHI